MQDVRRAMTDVDLVDELNRLESLDELSRCEELRLEIVQDELVRRQQSKVHQIVNGERRRRS